jgi:hypothetical protein
MISTSPRRSLDAARHAHAPSIGSAAAPGTGAASDHAAAQPESVLATYFRCPEDVVPLGVPADLSATEGYFTFGGVVAYGRCRGGLPGRHVRASLPDLSGCVTRDGDRVELPFVLDEIVTNLREERYAQAVRGYFGAASVIRSGYYALRPWLKVPVRRHLQRFRLSGWSRITFPAWPVDTSIEQLMKAALKSVLERGITERIPFIWFWPEGASACAIMTHDVEGSAGLGFCPELMNLDEAFSIPAAYQVVPAGPAAGARAVLEHLRARGFEVNVHDLTHDGSLFADKHAFPHKAARINGYAAQFGASGFRSGSMYREQSWFDAFDFSYDMSVPNVAHLEPQRGGCCTVMPYFVGRMLELPLTTTQDYSLFHILGDYSTALWREQIDLILQSNGLISFIAHPDYLVEPRARGVYVELLGHLCELRRTKNVWIALPGDVDCWWRSRRAMRLVRYGSGWRIVGPDSNRAQLAFASLRDGRVVFTRDGGQ